MEDVPTPPKADEGGYPGITEPKVIRGFVQNNNVIETLKQRADGIKQQ